MSGSIILRFLAVYVTLGSLAVFRLMKNARDLPFRFRFQNFMCAEIPLAVSRRVKLDKEFGKTAILFPDLTRRPSAALLIRLPSEDYDGCADEVSAQNRNSLPGSFRITRMLAGGRVARWSWRRPNSPGRGTKGAC